MSTIRHCLTSFLSALNAGSAAELTALDPMQFTRAELPATTQPVVTRLPRRFDHPVSTAALRHDIGRHTLRPSY